MEREGLSPGRGETSSRLQRNRELHRCSRKQALEKRGSLTHDPNSARRIHWQATTAGLTISGAERPPARHPPGERAYLWPSTVPVKYHE